MAYIPPQTIPTGSMMPYCGVLIPQGWLWCHGQAISRTTYGNLFSVISITYGAGDNSTTFNLPDFRGRVLMGAGQGSGLTNRTLGQIGGEENTLLQSQNVAKHFHYMFAYSGVVGIAVWSPVLGDGTVAIPNDCALKGTDVGDEDYAIAKTSIITSYAGKTSFQRTDNSVSSHNNMQPYLVISGMIIRI